MIRLRSQKLLSGVSGLAVLASFGLVSPALAAPTYPGPTNYTPITNDQAGAGATVLIGPDATIQANATTNDSFFNNLTMTGAGIKLRVQDSYLLGDIENTGTMQSSNSDGISIDTDSQIDGRIFNSGLIDGVGQGIVITGDSTVAGGINNTGTILGTVSAISVDDDSEIFGGITNAGRIIGVTRGISFLEADVEFFGGITNAAGGTISGAGDAGIEWAGTIFSGGINNSGLITGGDGIEVNTGTFTGGITNNAGGTIVGVSSAGIWLPGGLFNGNITNTGLIEGQNGNYGIRLDGGTITGNIVNNQGGIIQSTSSSGTAILMSSGVFTGNITNSGQILADSSSGQAIVVSGATVFTGNITNNATGRISADSTAILISNGTFTGNITNDGTIFSDDEDGISIATTVAFIGNVTNNGAIAGSPIGGTGILINTPTFTGTVTNAGVIEASEDGIKVTATTFTGNIVNTSTGFIKGAATGDGIETDIVTMTGDIINAGTIGNPGTLYVDGDGLDIDGTTLTGNVLNSGQIYAQDDGISINTGLTVTGNVTNAGTIFADANNGGGGSGITVGGIVQGTLVNSGLISVEGTAGGTAINVDGQVDGGITNSGSILGSDRAIDLRGADTATTIRQTAGLTRGRDGATIEIALDMVNTFNDSFQGSGGVVDGNILADGTDSFSAVGSGTFAYSRGTATGVFHLDNDGTGLFVLGSTARGVDGEGVTVGADHMYGNGVGADFYLDDDTTITLVSDFNLGAGDSIEFFLKEGAAAADYGSIASGATGDLTGSTVAVFVDPVTFGAPGGLSTYLYNNVITNIGADNFTNALDITTSSLFFTGTSTNDGANIDITLNRLDFADALAAAGATETQNQQAVAGALDAIYDNVAFSPEFTALFQDLFAGGLTSSEIQFIFDELSGSEHAQLQQVSLSVAGIFNSLVEERLDSSLLSLGGARMAGLQAQRYADAGTSASDGGAGGPGSHGLNRGASGTSVWLRGSGQWVNVDTDPEADGYDQDSNGVIGGVDHAINANALVGAAVSYSDTDVEFDEAGDTAELESWQAGLYGSYGFGRFYVDGQASYAWSDVNALRTITLPSATYVATSAYDTSAWSLQGELGAIWRLGRVNVQPSAALGYTSSDVDGFAETVVGAPGLGLVVSGADSDSLASTLAVRASGQWTMGQTRVVPDIKLGWRHEFNDDRESFGANFAEDLSSAAAFTVVSSEIQQDSLVVSTGATFGISRNFEVFVDVNGQYNADASATNASGGLRFTW